MNVAEKNRKVLITGATGFIGSAVAKQMVLDGCEVGIIKQKTSDTKRIDGIVDSLVTYDSNLNDIHGVMEAVSDFKPEVIFHLATSYAVSHKPDQIPAMIGTNVAGTVNLLEASQVNKIKLFVNTGSCFVCRPSTEKVNEECAREPVNLYALTKVHAEEACSFYAREYGLPCVTLRLFTPYGPLDHSRRLIPYILDSFLSGQSPKMTTGRQRWDFIYIDDIVEAYRKLLSVFVFKEKHTIIHVGSGEAVSIREIGLKLKEILRSPLPLLWGAIEHRNNELWHVCADIRRAKALLGWEPQIKVLETGLALTAERVKSFKRDEPAV